MAKVVRGDIRVARRSTAYVCDRSKKEDHRGQGLLLDLDGDQGVVVLTCHHVIAPVKKEDLCVRIPQENDQLGEPLSVRYDEERSHPTRDAVVLRVDEVRADERPLLHKLDLDTYSGSIDATVFSHIQPGIFNAKVRPRASIKPVPAKPTGNWPDSPASYDIQAFLLSEAADAREGISGGVVFGEGGVLGLVHFARAEGPHVERQGLVVPLTVWAEGWPALEKLIEPLIDENLRNLLRIRRPISEVNPFEERLVFPSALAQRDHEGNEPPYIHRHVDPDLRETLKTKQFVLVIGPSKAGKSRTAFEAARDIHPEPTLLVPKSPRALPELLGIGLPLDRSRSSVLWLDALDRYLEDRGMNSTLFDDLLKNGSRVVVLATMTWAAYERLRSAKDKIGQSAREILDLFEQIALSNELRPSERDEAIRLYPDQCFVAGIGEHFAAARELVDKFKAALEAHRHGFAVVTAALDWRRAGLSRPITGDELRQLYRLYLKRFSPLLEANDSDYQDGVEWARKPLESRSALLMPATEEGVEGFDIFDYVRDWADKAGGDVDPRLHAVPEPTWRFVVKIATSAEAYAIGLAAYIRRNYDVAESAWTKVTGLDDAPEALVNLGILLFTEQREYARAEEKLQRAINSGHPDEAPRALVNLGLLFLEQREYARAEEVLQSAIDSRHPMHAPWATINLGRLFEEQGDYARAEKAYQQAIDSYARAEKAYQQAIDSKHPTYAPMAAGALGLLFFGQGKYAQAEEKLQRAIESGHPDEAPMAAGALGLLFEEQGKYARAEEVLQSAIDSEHPKAAPMAASILEQLRENRAGAGA